MEVKISCILSFIFFSIYIFMMISSTMFSEPIPDGIELEGEYYGVHNYVVDYLPRWNFDPFDFYTSGLEELIINGCLLGGFWFMMDFVVLSYCHNYPKIINSSDNKNIKRKKFWEKIKNGKTKTKK